MDSRMNKYHQNDSNMSRVSRNTELYREINNSELDNFTVKSNATVLGNQEQEIDIEKIKKILDTKYKETAKRRSIRLEENDDDTSIVPESTTKEYDLNSFLAKARDDKEETYEEARAKKLRDTQFDILNNLNISLKEETEPEKEEKATDEGLMELINTITINEVKSNEKGEIKDEDIKESLELLSDLKGDDNTEVYEGLKEEIKKLEETSKMLENKMEETTDQSFFTTQSIFKKKDFENDLFENEKMNIGVKILLVLLVIAFLAGLILFLKSFLGS